jgi:hypothetical protein
MTRHDLESVALTLVSEGKGILAADETIPTLTKRFDTLGIQSTEQSRRSYREMLFTSPGVAEFISGVIMYDETIRQKSTGGMPLAEVQTVQGEVAGGLPCHGRSTEFRLRECKCARAGAVRRALSRAGVRADRRAGSADGRAAHD